MLAKSRPEESKQQITGELPTASCSVRGSPDVCTFGLSGCLTPVCPHTRVPAHTGSPTPPAGLHQQEARKARSDPWETRAPTIPLALCSPRRAWTSPSTHRGVCRASCTWPRATIFPEQLSRLPATHSGQGSACLRPKPGPY